jgi:hypothetical protein
MTNLAIELSSYKQQAGDAVRRGQMDLAEQIWQQVLEIAPNDQDGLFAMGFHAQMKGAIDLAVKRFRAAVEFSEPNPLFRFTLAKALKANGDLEGHYLAIVAALDADPYFVPAHLLRAESLIETNKIGAATQVYKDVFKIVGPRTDWPKQLQAELDRASVWLNAQILKLQETYLSALETIKSKEGPGDWGRMHETASILAGATRVFNQEPVMLHVPRLPAIPFYDTKDFPWAESLERQTPIILGELARCLAAGAGRWAPYVSYAPGLPVNQWADLNHSEKWSSIFFFKDGKKDKGTWQQFPETSRILQTLPLAEIDEFCPNVMFSALAPKSAIPPHTGETNARLVAHLPLIIPEGCRYRVGNEWIQWQPGKLVIFDDSIEHEAINDSDQLRVVLIFDLWNPLLAEHERAAVRALLRERNRRLG